jgi:hypothetical protein
MITYARSRLWVGILSVGTWVLLSLVVLFTINIFSKEFQNLSLSSSIFIYLGLYAIISLPFDFVGGFLLPRKYGRNTQSFINYIFSYIRGIAFQGAFLFGIAFLFLTLLTFFPLSSLLLPLLLSTFAIQILLALLQKPIAMLVSKFTISKSEENSSLDEVWESSDIGFTGGIPFLQKRTILPKKWKDSFSTDEVELLIKRRNFLKDKKSHIYGICGAILFNLVGVVFGYLGWIGSGITLEQNGYLSFLLVWASSVSLWSFLGLLYLPSLSQKATLMGDSSWIQEDKNKVKHLITSLDDYQDQEPKRQPQIQKIFHPIASVDIRLQVLENEQSTSFATWHIARYTLFFSWSILSFMGRGVHCNVGRPHLWVFLPSDG